MLKGILSNNTTGSKMTFLLFDGLKIKGNLVLKIICRIKCQSNAFMFMISGHIEVKVC